MNIEEQVHVDSGDDEGEAQGSRIRSKIAFPYSPLADAEQVAQALHRRGGTASMDELAAELPELVSLLGPN